MNTINCPSCGAAVRENIKYCKLAICEFCGGTLFFEDEGVKYSGSRSALTEIPSILELGVHFQYRNKRFIPYGRVQFDYGFGIWDEWWVKTKNDTEQWISVDEGEIAIESLMQHDGSAIPGYSAVRIGQTVTVENMPLIVTEKNSAACIGIDGQLPEVILPGDTLRFVHLSGPQSRLITIEYNADRVQLFEGHWIDPFDLRRI